MAGTVTRSLPGSLGGWLEMRMARDSERQEEEERLVGATGFEPATPCAQGRCATRLRYAPTLTASLILNHFQERDHQGDLKGCTIAGATVSKLCQNPSIDPRCVKTDVLFVGLPIQLE